jgi:hypothetical protein
LCGIVIALQVTLRRGWSGKASRSAAVRLCVASHEVK